MSVLTPMQRSFIETLFDHPELSRAQCIRQAGYRGNGEANRKMGARMMRNPLVLDGIRETAETTLRGKLPKTLHALDNIIGDPNHRGHQKTLLAVLDRTGMHAVSETHTTVTHTIDRGDLLTKLAALMDKHHLLSLPTPTVKDGDTIQQEAVDLSE
jgi:hypothetical protein